MILLQLIWAILSFAVSCYALVVTVRLLRKLWQRRRDICLRIERLCSSSLSCFSARLFEISVYIRRASPREATQDRPGPWSRGSGCRAGT
jgi:hypothetical protein